MRILAISDIESKTIYDHFDPERFKNIDLILSSGDLKADYLSYVVTVVNAPLLYVHGNHDRRFLSDPPEGCINIDGGIYTFKGLRIAGLGGCMAYSGGPFQFTEHEMHKRIKKNRFKYRKGFDILLTHAPAYKLGDGNDQAHTGYKCFVGLLEKHKPKWMIHGYQHLNYGKMERKIQYQETEIINAYDYVIIDV